MHSRSCWSGCITAHCRGIARSRPRTRRWSFRARLRGMRRTKERCSTEEKTALTRCEVRETRKTPRRTLSWGDASGLG